MIAALRYEWVRLTTIRSTYWIIGIALVFQAAMSALIAASLPSSGPASGGDTPFSWLVTIGASTGVAPLMVAYIIGLVGVFSMGHEYRHGMIRATLTAVPNRWAVFAAKVVTIALVAASAAVLCVVLAVASAAIFGVRMPSLQGALEISAGTTVYTVLFALSGLAVAAIVRNQTAAVAFVMLFPSVGEAIVRAIVLVIKATSDDPMSSGGLIGVLRFLPYDAGGQMYTRLSLDSALEIFGFEPFGALGGGIVMATFVGSLLALGGWLFSRRDA